MMGLELPKSPWPALISTGVAAGFAIELLKKYGKVPAITDNSQAGNARMMGLVGILFKWQGA
jgi:hypothetical protein